MAEGGLSVRYRSFTGAFRSAAQAEQILASGKGAVRIELVATKSNVSRIAAQAKTAQGQSLLDIAEQMVNEAKSIAGNFSDTGTLVRSIHSASTNYIGVGAEIDASDPYLSSDLPNATWDDIDWSEQGIAQLKAGSWLPYACVIEAVEHKYMTPSVELLRTSAGELVARAFKKAGL